jgi:hypothetical protein
MENSAAETATQADKVITNTSVIAAADDKNLFIKISASVWLLRIQLLIDETARAFLNASLNAAFDVAGGTDGLLL